MLTQRSQSGTQVVLHKLIADLRIKVNRATSDRCLADHPNEESLFAISDCLNEWNVTNYAFRIDKNSDEMANLRYPFLAHYTALKEQFILVHSIKNGIVEVTCPDSTKSNLQEKEFLKNWSGVLLNAAPDQSSGEVGFRHVKIAELFNAIKIPLLVITVLLLLVFKFPFTNLSVCLLATKLAGIVLSGVLLMKSYNFDNRIFDNICKISGKNGCDEILNTSASKLTKWLSWSEVGFFYFLSTFLFLIFEPVAINFVLLLAICTLPFICYSLLYQFKSKKWCILCCLVQVLLALEFILAISSLTFSHWENYAVISFPMLLFSFAVPVLSWTIIKPHLEKVQHLENDKRQLKAFKFNKELFQFILEKQQKYFLPPDVPSINLGLSSGKTEIIIVSNPMCAPCAKAHEKIKILLKKRADVNIRIMMIVPDIPSDTRYLVARHLIAISIYQGIDIATLALTEWYSAKFTAYEQWASKFPTTLCEKSKAILKIHTDWCHSNKITASPTVIVSGYKLPIVYDLLELIKLIE